MQVWVLKACNMVHQSGKPTPALNMHKRTLLRLHPKRSTSCAERSSTPYMLPTRSPAWTRASMLNSGVPTQQSPLSMYKAFTPRSSSKKPLLPQNVPQLQGSKLSQPAFDGCQGYRNLGQKGPTHVARHAVGCMCLCRIRPHLFLIFQNFLPSRSPHPTISTSWSMSAGTEVASCQMPLRYL